MEYQAFPQNSILLSKARTDASIAASLGELRDFTPEEIEYLSKQGHTFSDDTLKMAEDVKQLLSEYPDLLSRSIQRWHGWMVLHRLMFDNQFTTVKKESPELIISALIGKDFIHPDCKTTNYTPPDAIPSLVKYLSKLDKSRLFQYFPILQKRQIAANSAFTFDEAVDLLHKDMQTLLQFYELVASKGNEGIVVDLF